MSLYIWPQASWHLLAWTSLPWNDQEVHVRGPAPVSLDGFDLPAFVDVAPGQLSLLPFLILRHSFPL